MDENKISKTENVISEEWIQKRFRIIVKMLEWKQKVWNKMNETKR